MIISGEPPKKYSSQTQHLNWKREARSPGGNLLPQTVNLLNLTTCNLGLEVLLLVGLFGQLALHVLADLDALINVISDSDKVGLAHTTTRHGWSTDSDAAWGKSGLVTWNRVLVAGDVDLLEDGLDTSTIHGIWSQVEEDHVAVCSVGDELVATLLELNLEGFGVLDNVLLVLLEFRGHGLVQGNGKSGDGVVVGTTLVAGEDGEVDWALEVIEYLLARLGIGGADTLAEEDHCTSGATERLVCGGGNNIGIFERSGDDASSYQTGNMGHVDNEISTDKIGNLTHPLVVNQAAVSGCTGDEHLGTVHESVLLELLIIDDASLEVDAVWEGFEVGRDSGDPITKSITCSLPPRFHTHFLVGV
jgi:hypothetical protein